MSLRRFLAALPADFDLTQMVSLTRSRYASASDVNVVGNGDGTWSLAVYFDGFTPTQASLTLWQADVTAATVAHPTIDEQTATDGANLANLLVKAQQALNANAAATTTNAAYLAIASPSNAQVAAQVKALTQQQQTNLKELNSLIRAVFVLLDTISDT